jgi:hypothetical protein
VYGQIVILSEAAAALHNLHVTRDPTITDGAHVKKITAAAQRFDREITEAINRILKIQGDGLADIERRRAAKTNFKPDVYASEVRDMYRRMTPTERTALLDELVKDPARGSELAALISRVVPRSATGMTEEYRAKWEAAYLAKHAPELVAEEAALNEAAEAAFTTTKVAGEVAKAMTDPIQLAAVTAAEEAARSAEAAFNRTVGST